MLKLDIVTNIVSTLIECTIYTAILNAYWKYESKYRYVVSTLAATLACRNVTQEHIEELKMANKRFEAAIISKDVVAIVDADVNFHDIIYAMTDNQRLIQIINNLREQMYRYRLEYVKDARAHSILISEHKDIIDKLSKKDEENTKIVIRQHITNQEKGIIRLLNK